ncbi:hypothetical protein A2U01_0037957 [Trifolium medium]|uniref:Reverse transcriptase zinc-binding domain-containing protein n=1 Tax=Trifolium medium TaxID=97028 RepID=A0A392PXH2_9FABA|nr:hypothetical protein [Trifolium medium]
MDATSDLIWHKQIPLKVSVLALRLLRNRLPTKHNLAVRNIISQESQFCVTGCGGLETAQHLFLSCPVFAPLWGSRARRFFLQLVWLCYISVLWNERNNRVFKATETTLHVRQG